MRSKKPSIALIFGGMGQEHEISRSGAPYLYSLLDKEKYNVIPLLIERDGIMTSSAISDSGEITEGDTAAHLFRMFGRGGVIIDGDFTPLAAAIPLLHGDYGEDGTVQGALTTVGVPYIGCDGFAGTVCLDKIFTKIIAEHLGIPVAKYRYFTASGSPTATPAESTRKAYCVDEKATASNGNLSASEPRYSDSGTKSSTLYDCCTESTRKAYCVGEKATASNDNSSASEPRYSDSNENSQCFDAQAAATDIEAHLSYPVIVKPARLGSSVGISTAENRESLISALNLAYGSGGGRILCEEFLPVLCEAECACLFIGNERIFTSPGTVCTDGGFYDYQRKYSGVGGAKVSADSAISESQIELIKEYSRAIADFVGVRHLSRIDFFITRDGRIIFNEINTFPGFTSGSLYPKLIEAAGVTPAEAISRMLSEVCKA